MPKYIVTIDGQKYNVNSESPLTDEEAYSYAQQQHGGSPAQVEEPAAADPYSPGALNIVNASTLQDAFGRWAEEKKRQLGVGPGTSTASQKAQAVGGGLLDALALTSRPAQAVTAGINAKRLNAGGFLDTAGKQLLGGDATLDGNDLADVSYGWEPKGTTGKVVKTLGNMGRDIIGLGGVGNITGKTLRLAPGVAKAMSKAPAALKIASQVPNYIENVAPNAVISPILKGIGKGAGIVARETFKAAPEGVKSGLNAIARATANSKAGVNKAVTDIGDKSARLENSVNAFTNDIYLKAKDKYRNFFGEARNAEKNRIGSVITGKTEPIDKAEKLMRSEFVQKQHLKLAKLQEWQQRLRAIGVKDAFSETLSNITKPEDFYHRVYELPPHVLSKSNVSKIIKSLDENIATAAQRGEQVVADKLSKIREAYLTKDPQAIQNELGALEFSDNAAKVKGEESMGISSSSVFKRRVLPEHLAQVFKPKTDVDTLMKSERGIDSAFKSMEARVGLLEKQYAKKLPTPANPAEVDNFLENADKAGLFKGIGDVIPDVRTDKVTYEYIAHKLGEFGELEKLILHNPATQWITNTWKTYKLFHPAAITRNFIQGSSLAAQHGIDQFDYVPAVRTAYKMASGKMHEVPEDLRHVYSQLNGSGTSLSLSDLIEPTSITTFGAERIIPTKGRAAMGKIWDNLGQSFRSTDDGLRIAMFDKKVQELTGMPLNAAVKDKNAVLEAFRYVDENTIRYDDLPALARFMKLVNPFFAFTFRAPKQYIKAMAENPALTARFKASGQRETKQNLKGTSPGISKMFNAQRNLLAEAVNTFGGNIVIDSSGKINGIPSIDYIDMAPLSFAMRRPSAGIYNPTLGAQATDMAAQMTGMNLSGDAPAITPVGLAFQAAKIIPAFSGDGQESDKARRTIFQSLSPTLLNQVLSVAPPDYYAASGAGKLAKSVYPVRGSSPQRNFLTALGMKTKPETYEDIAKGFNAGISNAMSGPIATAQAEAAAMFPYDQEKRTAYVKAVVKKIQPEGKKKLSRVLEVLKGI